MESRRPAIMIGIGAAVAALGVTTVVGSAFAQTAPTPTQPPAQAAQPAQSQAKSNYQSFYIDRLAADLGTTADKLKAAFTQARNETVDQEVKDGKLTQAQADKIKSNTNVRPGFGFGFRGGERFGRGHEMGIGFIGGTQSRDAVAKALGMSTQDLNTQLQSKTLAQLAQGKEQAVKDAIVNTVKPSLDQRVKDGKMTQDQENQRLDQIQKMDLSKIGGHPVQHPTWRNHAPKPANNQAKPAA